ncbi:MAG TPA: glycerol-3-phosphate 1-O-acyltransferase PlsY [Candidatus Limnocylindrales bacterium]|nr:glycerol-3-phosphate 1-O-acyltransferase PlsY [Candidatus Limnocylindrales bacterium]
MLTREVFIGLISVLFGYFFGGIPWGIVVARVTGGPDPRTVGSGRTGGANVARALGARAAIATGLLDASKGAVAVLVAILLGGDVLVQGLAGLAAVLGHSRSPYIAFGGGRGVAPAMGALLVLQPLVAMLALAVYGLFFAATRYSSLGSLMGSLTAGVATVILTLAVPLPPAHLVYAIAGPAMIWFFHRDNIQRLLSGEERRLELRR